ncbi:MAG: TonB-dependent receptor [Ignavibacteria bacterium]|jgi:TonB-dependent receptor
MNFKHTILSPILIFFVISNALFASGSIKGVVIDSTSGEPLYGASVYLKGTGFGSATNFDGKFSIYNIPSGGYILRVQYVGYRTIEEKVQINDNTVLSLNFELSTIVMEGEEVVVMGQAVGQAAAINQQLSSNTIKNVVSSEKIMELPDANAAESVARLPGISLIRSGGEGNMVAIRGLSPAYNSIAIGGVQVPSTDTDDRSVDLSMISSEILSGIEVTKALTPDKDANAFGGVVDFRLATAKKGGFYSNLRVQTGYNDIRDDYGNYRASIIMSDRFFDEKFGIIVTANMERTQRGHDSYEADWVLLREKRSDEQYAPMTPEIIGLEYDENDRRRYGFSVLFDYTIPHGSIGLNSFLSKRQDLSATQSTDYNYSDAMVYRSFQKSRSRVAVMSTALEGKHDYDFMNIDWSLSYSSSETTTPFSNTFYFAQSGAIDLNQLSTTPTAKEVIGATTDDLTDSYFYRITSRRNAASENTNAYKIDFKMPYTLFSSLAGYLKFGTKFNRTTRDRDNISSFINMYSYYSSETEIYHPDYGKPGFEFQLVPGSGGQASILNYLDPYFDPGDFMNGDYEYENGLSEYILTYLLDNYVQDSALTYQRSASLNDYGVEENIAAGYAMTELNYGRFLTIISGVRFERTYLYLDGKTGTVPNEVTEYAYDDNPVNDTSATASYKNWFPMVHFRIKPTNWCDLRLAYTESISRPRMEWMLPNIRINGNDNTVEIGRPDLKPQVSKNYDLYLSVYSNKIGLFSVGGFYKDISDLIYLRSGHKILDPEAEGFPSNWKGLLLDAPENNTSKTEVYGIEFEWQSNLLWLPKPFNSLVININYSHIWSETDYPISYVNTETLTEYPYIRTTVVDTSRSGQMPDQANDIANISLGYDIDKFSCRISLAYQGESLAAVGEREELDGFTSPTSHLDLSLKYQFTDMFGVYFNMNNITNCADESYQQTESFMSSTQYYGLTADLGITVKL